MNRLEVYRSPASGPATWVRLARPNPPGVRLSRNLNILRCKTLFEAPLKAKGFSDHCQPGGLRCASARGHVALLSQMGANVREPVGRHFLCGRGVERAIGFARLKMVARAAASATAFTGAMTSDVAAHVSDTGVKAAEAAACGESSQHEPGCPSPKSRPRMRSSSRLSVERQMEIAAVLLQLGASAIDGV